MAYTFNVTALNDYIDEFKHKLISAPFTIGDASSEWDIATGNKYKQAINYNTNDVEIQYGVSCEFLPSGTEVLNQKEATVYPMFVHEQYCYEDLDKKYIALYSNPGTSTENSELMGEYFDTKVKKIAKKMENMYWNGDSAVVGQMSGILQQLAADGDRIQSFDIGTTPITSANVIAAVTEFKNDFPAEIDDQPNKRIYCSRDIYDLYIDALNINGQGVVEFGDPMKREVRILGTDIILKSVREFATQIMVGTYAMNIQKQTDLENEYEEFVFEDVPNTSSKAFRASWKGGIEYKFGEFIVTSF